MYLFSLLSWWNPFDYASSHTYHHRYTQYLDGDRENIFPLDPHLGPIFLLQIFIHLFLVTIIIITKIIIINKKIL